MMISPLKPYIRPDRDVNGAVPWYMGYVYRVEAIRCDVFYVIPLNFVVVWWNRVLFRLQFGPLYSHRVEDEYRRGERDGRVRGQLETQEKVQAILDQILSERRGR